MRRGTATVAVGLWVGLLAPIASAQESKEARVPAPTPTSVARVAIPALAAETQRQLDRLGEIRRELEERPVAAVMAEAEDLLPNLERERDLLAGVALERLAHQDRAELELEWERYLDRAAGWQREVTEASTRLEEARVELEAATRVWRTTRRNAAEEDVPDALLDRIDDLLERTDILRAELDGARAESLDALDRVATIRTEIEAILARFEDAKRGVWARAFAIDSRPLWTALFAAAETGGSGHGTGESAAPDGVDGDPEPARRVPDLGQSWERVRSYAERELAGFVVLALVLVVTYTILVLARRRLEHTELAEAERPRLAAVAHRPVAGSALATGVLAIWLLPGRPGAVTELIVVVVFAAWFRLVPTMVSRRLWIAMSLAAGLFLVGHYAEMVASTATGDRLVWFLVSAGGAGLGFAVLRRGGAVAAIPPAGWGLVVRIGVPVGLAILAAATLANLVGAALLTEALVRPTLASLAVVLVLMPAVAVAGAVVVLVMRRPGPWLVRAIRNRRLRIEGWLLTLVAVAALLGWIDFTLRAFGVGDLVRTRLGDAYVATWTIGSSQLSLAKFTTIVAVLVATFVIARAVRALLHDDVFTRVTLPRGVPDAVSSVVGYTIAGIGVLLAPLAAGVDFSNLAFIAGGLGVGIGFGLQNVVANFVSGLILTFERPVQIGDTVEVGPYTGSVRSIGVRSSRVRTFDGADVVLPNSKLVSDPVLNWTLSDFQRRRRLDIRVAYGPKPRRVIEILQDTAAAHPDVLGDPPPMALFEGFEEVGLRFRLLFWIPSGAVVLSAPSEVALAVYDALEAEGIEVPIPRHRYEVVGGSLPGGG